MRLGVRVGDGCAALHDEIMRFVQVNRLELDELWRLCGQETAPGEADRSGLTSAINMYSSASTPLGRRSSRIV
jgi:hypothetical protein